MKITEDIKPISYLKTQTSALFFQINNTHRPVIITQNGKPKVVIQDVETYEKMCNSFAMMKMMEKAEQSIQEGKKVKQEVLFQKINKKLLKQKNERT